MHPTSLRALGYLVVLLYPAGSLSWLVLDLSSAVLLARLGAGRRTGRAGPARAVPRGERSRGSRPRWPWRSPP